VYSIQCASVRENKGIGNMHPQYNLLLVRGNITFLVRGHVPENTLEACNAREKARETEWQSHINGPVPIRSDKHNSRLVCPLIISRSTV
jgi:hypothetical protein